MTNYWEIISVSHMQTLPLSFVDKNIGYKIVKMTW